MLTYDAIQVRRQWVKDLRSGEFEQVQGELKNDGGYCCLGVLCQRQDPDDELDWTWKVMPPRRVEDAAALDGKHSASFFAGLNDAEGYSFKDIARVIEEGLC